MLISAISECTKRAAVSTALALVVGVAVYIGWIHSSLPHPDLYEPWLGARSILSGLDPYPLVGPDRRYPNEFLFIYPLTSSIIVLPLAAFSLVVANGVFVGVSTALLGYAVTRDGWHRLILFFSVPFAAAAWGGQWSIIFSAAFLLPGLTWIYAAKPSIGAAMLLASWSRRTWTIALSGGGLIVMAAMLAVPSWPVEWMDALKANTAHMSAPIVRPGGFVALFALFRWRRKEARLIGFLSLVPQTPLWYEALPLLLVAKSRRETIILSIVSSLPILYEANFGRADGTFDVYPRGAQLALFAYLPCVIMVLLRRNEKTASSASGLPPSLIPA